MIKIQGIGAQGNYSQAGKAVADDTLRAFVAARRSSPDYGEVAITTAELRKQEKIQTLKNQSEVAAERLAVDTEVKVKKMGIDAKSNLDSAKRMAGVLAVGGSMFGKAADLYANADRKLRETGTNDEYYDRQRARAQKNLDEAQNDIDKYENFVYTEPGLESSTNDSSSNGSVLNPITPSGGDVNSADVYKYLTGEKGLSHNKAYGLMANIDRESSFRINPPGGDGGNSFGMLQWNNNYGRSDLMQSHVPDFNTNWKGQLDHALSQNQLPEYNKVTNDFLNTTFQTPQAASEYFLRKWEIPADVAGGIAKNNAFIAGYNYGQ